MSKATIIPANKQPEQSEQFKQLPKLTRKQQAFVNELKNNPKQSATRAVLKTYGKPDKELTYNTAHSIAVENLQKPAIVSHLDAYKDIVENTLTNTIIEYQNSDNIKQRTLAVDTSKYVHDKLFGKATQRTETTSLNVNIEALLNDL